MNRYKLKVDLLMIYYWVFNRKLYRAGKKFRKACKVLEVQEAFREAVTTIFEHVKSNPNNEKKNR